MTNVPGPWITTGGWSPSVCSRHGEPAQARSQARFMSKAPAWAIPFIVFGGIVYVIIVSIVRKTVVARAWPFCAACKSLRNQRLLIGLGLMLGGLVLFAAGAGFVSDDPEAPTGALMLLVGGIALVVGLVMLAASSWAAVAAGVVSADGAWLQFAKPDPRFDAEVGATIAHANELQAAAYQQWQAQQAQYAPPAPTQPQFGQPQYGQPHYGPQYGQAPQYGPHYGQPPQ